MERAARAEAAAAATRIVRERAALSDARCARRAQRAVVAVEAAVLGVPQMVLAAAAAMVATSAELAPALAVAASHAKIANGLALGSSDPHVLGLVDAKWREPRARSTFSLLTHEVADAHELMGRPFAWMNEPPSTEPLAPPTPQPSGAPLVTNVAQVVPRRVLAAVGSWRRRMRRCIDMAARGDVRMAERLRPPDLWLPADTCVTPEARGWVWDLRPLACGEPAVPWPTSGVNGVLPDTELNLPSIAASMSPPNIPFADCAIVDEMLRGVSDDTSMPQGTLLCAPHASALRSWSVAAERTSRNVAKLWACEGELPAWPLRVSPYGLVDESERAGEPKWRLTNDLSWPPPNVLPAGGGEFLASHNAAMDRSGWPPARMMRVRELTEAAAIMRASGAPVALWSVDCDSFYRVMGRQLAEVPRCAMAVAGGFQLDWRCCFGSAADACKCVRVSNFLMHHARLAMRAVDARYPTRDPRILAWQAQRAARATATVAGSATCGDDLHATGAYIDDCSGCSFNDLVYDSLGNAVLRAGRHATRAELHFDAMRETLRLFGHSSKPSKEQPPSTFINLLGVSIDLLADAVCLTDAKRERYAARAEAAAQQTSLPLREHQRLVGRLQFAAQCYPRGRQWLHAALRVSKACFRLAGGRVPVTARVRADLRRWAAELRREDHEGVPLACVPSVAAMGEPGTCAIYADASGSIGWAAWTVHDSELLLTGGLWSDAARDGLLICEKELFASTAGLVTLAAACGATDVWSYTDNAVALSAMRSNAPSSLRMQQLVAARLEWMLAGGVREAAERVSSAANLWADLGSRGHFAEVEIQAAALGLRTRWLPQPPQWAAADGLLLTEGGGSPSQLA